MGAVYVIGPYFVIHLQALCAGDMPLLTVCNTKNTFAHTSKRLPDVTRIF